MCDPVTIAGIALTAGSTVVNSMAAGKAQRARDDALAAERIRQTGLDREAQALNTQSQDRYTDFSGQQDERSKELGDYFTEQQIEKGSANEQAAQDMADAALPTSTSNITMAEENNQRGKAREFSNAQGEALGNLRAFGDLLGEVGRYQARDASQIGQIGGFKRGSAGVLPYELDAASHTADDMKLFGDILGLGGSVGTAAGLGGGSLSGLFNGPVVLPGAVTQSAKGAATLGSAANGGLGGAYRIY